MADAALAQKRCAPTDRPHRNRLLGRGSCRCLQALPADLRHLRAGRRARGIARRAWSFARHRTCPRALTASIASANASATCSRVTSSSQRLAERHEQRSVERAGGAADFHDERGPDALQGFAKVLGGEFINGRQHRFKSAAHIGPVIAVADRAIEIGQFIGARNDTLCHGLRTEVCESRDRSSCAPSGFIGTDPAAGLVEIKRLSRIRARPDRPP